MALRTQICLILLIWLSVTSWNTDAAQSPCRIPRGEQYERSTYRPQNDSTIIYKEGQFVRHLTKVRVVCKKDIYHDSITDWTYSKCNSGRWIPELPSCIELKRCRAPPEVPHATASEPINQYITFAHGTFVTYTCDEGRVATGLGKTQCQNGVWKPMDFECRVPVPFTTERPRDQNDQPQASAVFGSEQNGAHGCEIPEYVLQSSVLRVKQTEEIPSAYVDHWTQLVQTCVAEGTRRPAKRDVKCVNGRWRPDFMTCSRPQGRSRITRVRTYKECVIPDWKHEETTATFLKEANTSLKPGESVTHGDIIKLRCSTTSGSNNSISDKFFQCLNGNWKPELQPCVPDVTSEVGKYKVNENEPPSALLSKQNTEQMMNDVGIPYDVNDFSSYTFDGIPVDTYDELPYDTFDSKPFDTYNEPNTTEKNMPFYTGEVTAAEETNVTAAPTSYRDDYTPGVKREEDRAESKDTQSRDNYSNSETRGKDIITRGENKSTGDSDRDSDTRDIDSYSRDRDSKTRDRDDNTSDLDSSTLEKDRETRDRNSNTRDIETEPRDLDEDANTDDTDSDDVNRDSDGSDDKVFYAGRQRRKDLDSYESSDSTSSEDSDSSESD